MAVVEQSTLTMTECQITNNGTPLLVSNATLLVSNSQFVGTTVGCLTIRVGVIHAMAQITAAVCAAAPLALSGVRKCS